jgi:hypothetical protein
VQQLLPVHLSPPVNDHMGSCSGSGCRLIPLHVDEQREKIEEVRGLLAFDDASSNHPGGFQDQAVGNHLGTSSPFLSPPFHDVSPRSTTAHLDKVESSHSIFPLTVANQPRDTEDDAEDDVDLLALENENLRLRVEHKSMDSAKQKRIRELRIDNERLRQELATGVSSASASSNPTRQAHTRQRLVDYDDVTLSKMSSSQLHRLLVDHEAEKQNAQVDEERRQLLHRVHLAKLGSQSLAQPGPSSFTQAPAPASTESGEAPKPFSLPSCHPSKLKSGAVEKWETNVCKQERYPHRFVGSFMHQFDSENKEWTQNSSLCCWLDANPQTRPLLPERHVKDKTKRLT